MYRHITLWLCFAVSIMLGGPAHGKTPTALGLRATQNVVGIDAPTSSFLLEHAPINFGSSQVAAGTVQRQSVSEARSISVSVREYGYGTMTKGEITQAAKSIMLPSKAEAIGQMIKAFIAQGKVGHGVFIFEQQVRPKGVDRDMKLTWSVTVTDGGQVVAGDPKVVDADPTIVYLVYTSLAVEAGLPAGWKWTDGGSLQWQLRRRDGTPTTNWAAVNTGGAFDERDDDSEAMIRCLADRSRGACPSGYVDARTLMEDTASVASIIDYVRKVAPQYDEQTDSSGQTLYAPRMAMSYDQRTLLRSSCSAGTYRNAGRIGYTLKTTIDRYQLFESQTVAARINRFESESISPTQTFDVSASISNGFTSLSNKLLSPYTQDILYIADIPGVQYVAPVQVTSSNDQAILISGGPSNVSVSQPFRGKYVLDFVGTPTGSGPAAATTVTLQLNPQDFTNFYIDFMSFDWYGAVKINGVEVLYGPSFAYVHNGPIYCSSNNLWWGGCWASYYGEERMNQQISVDVNILPYLVNGNNTIQLMSIRNGITRARMQATSCLANESF